MNTRISKQQWQEEEALRRFQLISPLLQPDLDDAKRIMIRKKIAEENQISVRPFKQMIQRLNRTYKASYRPTNGFDNIDGANYDLALWVAYYNFLRPHKHAGYHVLIFKVHLSLFFQLSFFILYLTLPFFLPSF